MARAKFASFSMHADDEEMFLDPNDAEFKEALSLLRKVPRKPSNINGPAPVSKNTVNPWVVFVMGGPGSSAPSLCAELARLRGFTYIEAQTIIREEIASESILGKRILQSISQGRVPIDATISVIMRAIMAASGTRVLVHGFPQDLEQAQTYEHAVGKCQAVLYVKCSRRLMQKRLLGAGGYGSVGGGEMDQTLTLQQARKRILDFEDTVEPVLTYFQLSSKVHVLRDGPALNKIISATDQLLSAYATPNRTFGTQTATDGDNTGMTSIGNDEFDSSVGRMKEKPSPFIPPGEQVTEPTIGPSGETINFQRGGTPIQENLPKPPPGESPGQSPLHNRATLRSRRGDPATEAGPRAELARWFARIGIMVGAPDNWRREFSGGFIIAQCLEVYFPRAIQSKGFHTGSSMQYKRDNWRQLQQFFLKFNHPLDDSEIKDVMNAKKGKIVPFLLRMHFFIASQGLVDPLKNKPPEKNDKNGKNSGTDSSTLPSVLLGGQSSMKKSMRSGKGASVTFQMDNTIGGVSGYGSSTRRR